MAEIVPTILAADPDQYAQMLEKVSSLSSRLHIDISDGEFTEGQTIAITQVHAPEDELLDLHLMVRDPSLVIESAISLKPHLIILHAEANEAGVAMAHSRELGVKSGIALLPETSVESAKELVQKADHVLIFTGHLGFNGGTLNLDQLSKVAEIRQINQACEISVDGGVTAENAALVALQGVDVLYTGGYIQNAEDPATAFAALKHQAGTTQ